MLAFTVLGSLAVGAFCGVWPLVLLRTRQLASAVREADMRTGSGGKRFGSGVVVAEIALAFALLVGAGLPVTGLILGAVGVAAGATGAWLLTGVLKTMLNDVKPTDLTVFVTTGAAVLVVAVVASYFPARAAGKVDPMVVLRDV